MAVDGISVDGNSSLAACLDLPVTGCWFCPSTLTVARQELKRFRSADISVKGNAALLHSPLLSKKTSKKIAASGPAHWCSAEALRARWAVQIPAPTFARGDVPDAWNYAHKFSRNTRLQGLSRHNSGSPYGLPPHLFHDPLTVPSPRAPASAGI